MDPSARSPVAARIAAGLAIVVVLSVIGAAHSLYAASPVPDIALPPGGASVPMLDFGGRPVIEVHINGKGPYRLILDTGADMTVIDDSLAAEVSAAGGSTLRELRIGPVTIKDHAVQTGPISSRLMGPDAPRGVMSASAFPGLLLSFDFSARRVSLVPGSLPEPDGLTVFSYQGEDLPSLPLKVAGREITVDLDTGAPFALALPTRYIKELPLAAEPVRAGTAQTHAGSHPIYAATLTGEVEVGKFKLPMRDLRFTDVVPHMFAQPKGQIGNPAFAGFILTLDSANRRIRLERSGTTS